MKKIYFLAGALGLLIVIPFFFKKSSVSQSQGPLDELIVGTNPNFPPFEFIENGKLVGFDIDVMNEVGKRTGMKVTYKDLAFDALLLEIAFGRIHAIASGMTPTAERAEQVLFTKPYLEKDPLVVISLASNPPLKSLNDLKGGDKEVIVNDGYTAESYMDKQKGITLKRLATPAEAFLALTTGRGYAYVSSRSAVQPFFDQYGTQKFNIFVIDEAADSYALAVSKRHPEILEKIEHGLDALHADGTLEKLKKKWHLSW